jgi:predicted  nucleic acid-binding Zn-ribbon protein
MWTKESFKSQLAQSAIAHSAELQRQREALEAQLDEDRHAMEAKVEGMRSEMEGRLKAVKAEKREGDAELARAKAEVWGMRRKDTEAQERIKAAEDAIKEAEKRLEERELASGKEIDALLEGKWRAVRSIEEKVAKISDLEGTVWKMLLGKYF